MSVRTEKKPKDTLEELQVITEDKIGPWIHANRNRLFAGAGTVLGVVAVLSLAMWWNGQAAERASTAFAKAQQDYYKAMGAEPGSVELVEPANPETARQVREEHLQRFAEVAEAHRKTPAAALAWVEIAQIYERQGDSTEALEAWKKAAAQVSAKNGLRGLLLQRLASAYEEENLWAEAAAGHLEAGKIKEYPMNTLALAAAARCYLEAGESEKALEIYRPIEADEANAKLLPPYVKARLDSLLAAEKNEKAAS